MTSPRWARALLRRVAPRGHADELIGDLEEVHRRRLARRGRLRAAILTGCEALSIVGSLLLSRLGGAVETGWFTLSEARLALRLLVRSPFMSATAVIALAVGICLATAGFTVLDGVLHPSLPFAGGDRFVDIRVLAVDDGRRLPVEPEVWQRWQHGVAGLEHLAAVRVSKVNLVHPGGEVELVAGLGLTPTTFRHLPLVPVVGRLLAAADAAPGAEPVALLHESLWQRQYGRDPGLIGRRIDVGGVERSVVGVLPADAVFPAAADVWVPLRRDELQDSAQGADPLLALFGVLAEGADPGAVEAQLTGLTMEHVPRDPSVGGVVAEVRPVGETDVGRLPGGLLVVLLVGLLLVVAGNVASLVIARTAARRPELAVRAALGAGRHRIVAQLSFEVLVLVALAAVLGLWGSASALSLLARSEADDLPPWLDLGLDLRTVAFVLGVTLVATVVAGVLPALRATRGDLSESLRGEGANAVPTAFGARDDLMIVLQISLSVAILGAALMVHQGWAGAYAGRDPGVAGDRILTARVTLGGDPELPLPLAADAADLSELRQSVTRAAAGLAGASRATTSTHVPGTDAPLRRFELEPTSGDPSPEMLRVGMAEVGPGFFDVLETGAVSGRPFRDEDYRSGARPVALVNEAFVERVLDGANAVGRRLREVRPGDEAASHWRQIVGVVPDLGMSAADPERDAGIYLPIGGRPSFVVLVATTSSIPALGQELRRAVFAVSPEVAVDQVATLAERMAERRRVYLYMGSVFTSLGGIVLLLSLTAIYAILSFEVTRRTREIGVRVALGASDGRIVRPIAARVGAYVLVGGLLGSGLGFLLLGLIRATLVMRFPATGPEIFLGLILVTLIAALGAAWVPTRRALRISPMAALRAE